MAPGPSQPSAPFASRELNGQVLLEELGELMQAQIAQRHLDDCVVCLRDLDGIRASEASARLKHLADNRFSSQPALGRLLVEWSGKVKVEADIPLLKNHFFRLAMASAVLSALRRGAERLGEGEPPMSSRAVDMLSNEVREHLERWPAKERALFVELLEDAPSELQREFLQRTVAAGHSPPEVHAFADALRSMTDAEAFVACTLEADAPDGYTVVQLLRAEADPLYAYELKGGELSPNETMESAEWQIPARLATEPPPPSDPNWMNPYTPGAGRAVTEIGASSGAFLQRRSNTGSFEAPLGSAIVADLLNEATRALGVAWREVIVDDVGGNPLEDILGPIAEALQKGITVPVAVGPSPGHHRRFCLMLQLSVSGKSRAFQMYDPFGHELVWANEGTLLSRTELPFDDKANRRITRVVLPLAPR